MTNHGRRGHLQVWVLAAIVLLAFGLRLYRLGAESLWYDETVSVHLAGKSLPDLIAHTAGDIHPPGYYVLLHVWTRVAGSSDFAVAFPSLLLGVLLVAVAYRLGSMVFGVQAGLLASFLVAISPHNIWYSQEVRMYTLGAALGLGVLGAVLHLVLATASRQRPRLWWLAVYAVCGALGLWSLYYFAFMLLAVNLMVGLWWLVVWRRRQVSAGWLAQWLLAQAGVLLLYLPWIPVALHQATEPPVPPWRGSTALGDVVLETWSALSLGQSVTPGRFWPALVLFAVFFLLGLLHKSAGRRPAEQDLESGASEIWPARWFLVGYLCLPLLLIYLASFVTPLYHVRYVFTFAIPFYMIVGAGVAWLLRRWRPAAWLALAVMVAFSGISVYAYHTDPQYISDDHRAAVRVLSEQWRPGDAILVNAGYAYTALLIYWQGDPIAWRGRLVNDGAPGWCGSTCNGPVVVQTGTVGGAPSLGWGDAESDFYAMSRAETEEALARLFTEFDRVWVYRVYDTVTDPDGLIRIWLDEHGTRFFDEVFSGASSLRVQGYLTGRDPRSDASVAMDAGLADGWLQLVARSQLPSSAEIGGVVDVALVWEVDARPDMDATLFAGLFDERGWRWAQTDEHPLGPLYVATDWPVGAQIRTPLRLEIPAGTPPGRYRLEVGWYRFVEGQPIWLPWTPGERQLLGEVEVVAPQDWQALRRPAAAHSAEVTIGEGVRLLGFDSESFEVHPGDVLHLEFLWLGLVDGPGVGPAVIELRDRAGRVMAQAISAPAGGRAPFVTLETGQVIRDPLALEIPGDLSPGLYDLTIGRLRDGCWLAVRRGPFSLGLTYPLATIRVIEENPARE